MNTKRKFLPVLLLITIMFIFIKRATLLLVPKDLSPKIIEDLESNYQSMKGLYRQAARLTNLLSEEDYSSISKFLDDFKNCVDDPTYQENRSGSLVQKIYLKFQRMESIVNHTDSFLLNKENLREKGIDMQKLVAELEAKIDGIKADPMMFTMEKAENLFRETQALKEKFSRPSDSSEALYEIKALSEAKVKEADELEKKKFEIDFQIRDKVDKNESKNRLLERAEDEKREVNKKLEEIQKQIEDPDSPKFQISEPKSQNENVTPKVYHYIDVVDVSSRRGNPNHLKEVYSVMEARKSVGGSEKDVASLVTFDFEAKIQYERAPQNSNENFDLRNLSFDQPGFSIHKFYNNFEEALKKMSRILESSKSKGEIPVVTLYLDGMRWYFEAEPVLKDPRRKEGFFSFFWEICYQIMNYFWSIFGRKWLFRPIKEDDMSKITKLLVDFSERHLHLNLMSFVFGTTFRNWQNKEILRNLAEAFNGNHPRLQSISRKTFEYFNTARKTEFFKKIFWTLTSLLEQAIKGIEKQAENMTKESATQNDEKNSGKKSIHELRKDRNDLEIKLEDLEKKEKGILSQIKSLDSEIQKLQADRNPLESKILVLKKEIYEANEKSFEEEQVKKYQEKLADKNSVILTHLEKLEQLTKTVQARDHNIMAIFEYFTSELKNFLTGFEIVFKKDQDLNFNSQIETKKLIIEDQRKEIKKLFSQEIMSLFKNLDNKIYMMY